MRRFWKWATTSSTDRRLDLIISLVTDLQHRISQMSDSTDAAIAALQADVQAEADVVHSAVTLLNGLSAQLAAALSSAQNQGASPAQLSELNDLQHAIEASTASLAAAVAADTPAPAPAPAPEPAPEPAPAPAEPVPPVDGGPDVPPAPEPAPEAPAAPAGDDSVSG
jgi:hypothetical protein